MKNKKHHAYTGGSVTLALPVPAGTKSGHIVKLGNAGFYGIAATDVVSPEQATSGKHPQGLIEGQASVFLPGIVLTVGVPAADVAAVADFGKVDWDAGTKKFVAAGAAFVGYKLGATTIGLRAN
ncbi:hypothetical protein [Deinococcus multiflagellatus]|uniref:DUF2190 family protein n=1 Tax=Deinococcus multiflagellatus TaxID=1656887 RepID=A0ABW1ZH25_9DEIO|nr:hypothetical protein [Deinococcus multiflagellatus]MBZ9713758.1 hypothetical protein [Deinococcus multiflagellatus]